PDRVLGDLHEHGLAGLERLLDPWRPALDRARVVVDLAGVEHRVAPAADVDERGLHARQDVLHLAEIDVADHRRLVLARDVVLDEHAVLEHADLGALVGLAHHHDPLDRLAAGQELGLGDDRWAAPTGVASVPATLPLGLQPGRSLDPAHPVVVLIRGTRGRSLARGPRLAHVHGRLDAVLGGRLVGVGLTVTGASASAPAPSRRRLGR